MNFSGEKRGMPEVIGRLVLWAIVLTLIATIGGWAATAFVVALSGVVYLVVRSLRAS